MAMASQTKSTVHQLASRLEQDIRQRGLLAGDRYLTAAEVSEMLGASLPAAHRAMKILAQREMLVRHRSRGTFIGPHFETKNAHTIRTVYIVMEPPGLERDAVPLEDMIYGIRSEIANANVQISFLPTDDVESYIREFVQSAVSAGQVAGFIPISCPREVYRRLADSGIPTVVFGTPWIDQRDIPSLDVDNRQAGLLLAEYLAKSGHKRMAVFMTSEEQPGTNCFYDGVSEALTAAHLPHNALIQRMVALAPESVAAQLHELLAMPNPPTALIARTPTMAKVVNTAFDRLKIPASERCEVVYQNHPATESNEQLPYNVFVRPELSFHEMVKRIGKMIEQLSGRTPLEQQRVLVPMERIDNRLCCGTRQE